MPPWERTEVHVPERILQNDTTLSVFLTLIASEEPIGVRTIQRKVGMNNPSSVHWHLQKLIDEGVVTKTDSNLYLVREPYQNLSRIELPVRLNHYLVGGHAIPDVMVQIIFLLINTLVIVTAVLLGNFIFAAFVGMFTCIFNLALMIKFYRTFKRKISTRG